MVVRFEGGSGVSVYQISGSNTSRALPDWVAKKRRKELKKDLEYQNRIELIQDFEFSEASNRIKVTRDNMYAMATGTYKPQIHVYEFANLALKFERHTDSENVDFVLLSDDWTKSVHLQNDRSIEFQGQGQLHTSIRIPKFGRAIDYHFPSCDLFVAASGNEVYRFNLEQGRFLAPYEMESEGVNCLSINKGHGLLGFGLENGSVEFWDPRARSRVGQLQLEPSDGGCTAIGYNDDGLGLALGTEEGKTYIYDLRNPEPILSRYQGYSDPIKNLIWMRNSDDRTRLLSANRKLIKIFDATDGKTFTMIEPSVDLNDVAHIPGSGMFFTANEGQPMNTYYIPMLGPAPKWCSFLDNVTEELEEAPATTTYDNYKFVSRKELKELNLGHLIGSNVVRSYMHGFFIDQRLYEQAKLITNPFAYNDHRERTIKKKIDQERESRIRTKSNGNKKFKVNKELAQRLSSVDAGKDTFTDDRFKELFTNEDFAIDQDSNQFKLHMRKYKEGDENGLRKENWAKTAAEESDDERIEHKKRSPSDDEDSDESSSNESESENISHVQTQKDKRPKMKVLSESSTSIDNMTNSNHAAAAGEDKATLSFESRAKAQLEKDQREARLKRDTIVRKGPKGEAEITFTVDDSKKSKSKGMGQRSSRRSGDDEYGSSKDDTAKNGRTKQRFSSRRSASNNVMRQLH